MKGSHPFRMHHWEVGAHVLRLWWLGCRRRAMLQGEVTEAVTRCVIQRWVKFASAMASLISVKKTHAASVLPAGATETQRKHLCQPHEGTKKREKKTKEDMFGKISRKIEVLTSSGVTCLSACLRNMRA